MRSIALITGLSKVTFLIIFNLAPEVGKTFRMLDEAHALEKEGIKDLTPSIYY